MNELQSGLKYLQIASDRLNIPLKVLNEAWSQGKEVRIPVDTHLGLNHLFQTQAIFVHSGIIREYFVDHKGLEHTIRLVQNPAMIAPPLNNEMTDTDTVILSQTLTPIKGRVWELEFMMRQAEQNPMFFRSIIAILCEAAFIKERNDTRFNLCSAKERYLLFLNEFPEVVNKVSLKHISSYLKMTPETISRIRTELKK